MKKYILLLTATLLLSLCACNPSPDPQESESMTAATPSPETAESSHTPEPSETAKPSHTNEPSESPKPSENPHNDIIYLRKNYDRLHIDGSSSTIPLHRSLHKLFSSRPNESLYHNKTVDAFTMLVEGENDLLIGVDYSDELLQYAKDQGLDLEKRAIAREGFVFLINKNNPVRNLTVEQIKGIYSGQITNWKEVGGDDSPITAFQRNSDSGSQMAMVRFMGDTPLTTVDVIYDSTMGDVIASVSNFDSGKYSIAYNIYTFTEKQYPSDEVVLLSVNGVSPNDMTIFNETYPITIYNYIHYDRNNSFAAEFAEHLYCYLMSDNGQQLISKSGYVNLNIQYDRNNEIEPPYDHDDIIYYGFYDEEKGEFYDINGNNELLIFYNYPDYVLQNSKYINHKNARNFLDVVFEYISKDPLTVHFREDEGAITIDLHFDATFDEDDLFNYRYQDQYYASLTYYIEEDIYVLESAEKNTFNFFYEDGYLDDYTEYAKNYTADAKVTLTRSDLSELYFRAANSDYERTKDGIVLPYELLIP